jgi:hypothetical protein
MGSFDLCEEDSEKNNTPPISDALTASIRDFLQDGDLIAIEIRGSIFRAVGDRDGRTQTHFAMAKIECLNDVMTAIARKFLFFRI